MSEQEQIRREKLQQLIEMGIEPYPGGRYEVSHLAADIVEHYQETIDEDGVKKPLNFQVLSVAGRIMAVREAGKALFMHLQDSSGRIQLYLRREEIAPGDDTSFFDVAIKKLLDLGDYVGVKGFAFRTKTGEVTIHVQDFQFLSKSLRPLPIVKRDAEGNTYDAFTDPEQRHRMRYVDLTVNPEYRRIFITRSRMISAMRRFFDQNGWLEVETPILQPIHGGAAARPFATHHNALDIPLYMRIANELYLKRLIGAGFDGVYEIGKMFRNEGIDRTHNPEFTMMEIYVAYKDYFWMMDMVEELLAFIAAELFGSTRIQVGDNEINLQGPFKRMPIYQGILEYTGADVSGMDEAGLRSLCLKHHIEVDPSMGRAKLLDELFSELVEPHLIQPTFVMDHPVEMTPLAKKHRSKPGLVERFELFINRKEVGNAYSELNDPLDQRARFEEQLELAVRGDEEAMRLDDDFLRAMEYGMPPMSGLGIGIDRLAMLMTNQVSIQEVLFFPQMRPE